MCRLSVTNIYKNIFKNFYLKEELQYVTVMMFHSTTVQLLNVCSYLYLSSLRSTFLLAVASFVSIYGTKNLVQSSTLISSFRLSGSQ